MSTVIITWVPEGIAVSADTRTTSENFELENDYAVKILPFERYKFFVTLCGSCYFGNKKFEEFIQDIVDKYFTKSTHLSKFAEILLKLILEKEECKDFIYEIIIAGYDLINDREVIEVIKKGKDNDFFEDEDTYIRELNIFKTENAQTMLFYPASYFLYGAYVGGVDINGINNAYKTEKDRLKMDKYFSNMSLDEASDFCERILENTKDKLKENNSYSVTGGMTLKYFIKATKERNIDEMYSD